MGQKRSHDASGIATGHVNGSSDSSSKRQRVDSATPNVELSPHERELLGKWLDKQVDDDKELFRIKYPAPGAKGKRQAAGKGGYIEHLLLDNQPYGTVRYTVSQKKRWDQLVKYRRCTVSEQRFALGECVLVKGSDPTHVPDDEDASLSQWKAQIREVRALDEHHVYLRVAWLYRPSQDLPGGARPYHGTYELIPSTEMCIIDAKTIEGPLQVKYWDEYQDDEIHDATEYFWRQSFDHVSQTLSTCRTICKCAQPQNPDRQIVQCSRCNDWQHAKCLEQSVLDRYMMEHALIDQESKPLLDNKEFKPSLDGQSKPYARTPVKPGSKKGRAFKAPDLNSPTEMDGVTATLNPESDHGKVKVLVQDTRLTDIKPIEIEPMCLLCGEALDGEEPTIKAES